MYLPSYCGVNDDEDEDEDDDEGDDDDICHLIVVSMMMTMMMIMMMMIYFLYSTKSNFALNAEQLLKHEPVHRLFFAHTNIHKAAILGASTIFSHTYITFTHSEVAEISILNLLGEIRTRVSRVWFVPLDHYATTPRVIGCNLLGMARAVVNFPPTKLALATTVLSP